jgi:hypothetical protein
MAGICSAPSTIDGTPHGKPRFVEDMSVDHRGGHVLVAEKLLNRPDVVIFSNDSLFWATIDVRA